MGGHQLWAGPAATHRSPPLFRCPRPRNTTSAIAAGDEVTIWTGNRSLALTHVTSDGRISSFPQIHGTICLRTHSRWNDLVRRRKGGSSCGILQGLGFRLCLPRREQVGPIMSLAVDRNNELWINTATGGTYHLTGAAEPAR